MTNSLKHNKLVRDRIPELILRRGRTPVCRTLGVDEFRQALRRKLQEEAAEFLESGRVEELADVLEVVYALAAADSVSESQLNDVRQSKRHERGGFSQRIFLVETIGS